jgi:hypothetical protein
MKSRHLRFPAFVFGLATVGTLWGVPNEDVDQPIPRSEPGNYDIDEDYDNQIWRWSNSQIRGISEARLPDTQPGGTWRLSFSPRFGDFFNREYVRYPLGVTYGINNRTEVEVFAEPYSPNPFKSGGDWGMANYYLATKHQWSSPKAREFAAASGLEVRIPVQGAPYDSNEGMNRYSVFTTFGRQAWDFENVYGYLNLGYDFLTESRADGIIPAWKPQDDFVEIVVGALYHRNDIVWGLSGGWQHVVDGPSDNFFTLIPSATFDLPPDWVLNLPGRWQVGTAVEFRLHDGDIDPAFKAKVRWIIDFRTAVKHIKDSVPLPSMPSIPFINNGNREDE